MRVNGVVSAIEANAPPGSILDLNEAGPAMRHACRQIAGMVKEQNNGSRVTGARSRDSSFRTGSRTASRRAS
ncbi:MAG TPA: hypothetical protein PK177_18700, partial [Burkholderiaceae bacterium]|nr:hypothetical protein [Burkholderiaceae bacterium]